MKWLIDENLPFQIGRELALDYLHATRIGEQITDSELWNYAKQNNMVILTRDTDFFDRFLLLGPPPKVVWIRLGNLTKQQLIEEVVRRWNTIGRLIQKHDLIQVHPQSLETMDFPEDPLP
ncbi:MAG: DUF5615 family PIN-like protein [Luteolibacter sp.]